MSRHSEPQKRGRPRATSLPHWLKQDAKRYIEKYKDRGGPYDPTYTPPGHEKNVKAMCVITQKLEDVKRARTKLQWWGAIYNLFKAMDSHLPNVPLPIGRVSRDYWFDFNTEFEPPAIQSTFVVLGSGQTKKSTEKRNCLGLPNPTVAGTMGEYDQSSGYKHLFVAEGIIGLVNQQIQQQWEKYHEPDPRILRNFKAPTHIKRRRDPLLIELAVAIARNKEPVDYISIEAMIQSSGIYEFKASILKRTVKVVRRWNLGEPLPENTRVVKGLYAR